MSTVAWPRLPSRTHSVFVASKGWFSPGWSVPSKSTGPPAPARTCSQHGASVACVIKAKWSRPVEYTASDPLSLTGVVDIVDGGGLVGGGLGGAGAGAMGLDCAIPATDWALG